MSAARSIRTLVVDDDEGLARFLVELLTDAGHDAHAVPTARDAMASFAHGAWDLVVTDVRMPGVSGLELIAWIHATHPATARVAITAFGSAQSAEQARRAGATAYLVKPFEPDALLAAVDRSLGVRPPEAADPRDGPGDGREPR